MPPGLHTIRRISMGSGNEILGVKMYYLACPGPPVYCLLALVNVEILLQRICHKMGLDMAFFHP